MDFLDLSVLTGSAQNQSITTTDSTELTTIDNNEPPKKKRGRPRKDQSSISAPAAIVGNKPSTDMVSMCQTSDPYIDTFAETNDMLKFSILQLDVLAGDVKNELDNIRSSKTLKGKYKYIADLCSTASSLVSTKVSAIKEINAVTHNCHKLELQRVKDIKNSVANQQDDDKYITDLYRAYITTPVGAGSNNLVTKYNSTNVAGNMNALMNGINTSVVNEEQNFQNFMNNLTPEQNRMILGNNSNIETVVVYDPTTGEKSFEVIDSSTGMSVPNYPRPASSLLDDTSIDMATGMASNTNIGQNWKVVVLGDMINKF